jgi:hypothetical protein
VREFETAERLNPNLAAPHFQLYNLYRQAGRTADAARELAIFQKLKALTEGAVIPEDMEWSYYAEIYDPIAPRPESEPVPPPKFEDRKLATGADAASIPPPPACWSWMPSATAVPACSPGRPRRAALPERNHAGRRFRPGRDQEYRLHRRRRLR